ncbi:MAG: GAF domain-containing protein [Myxococcales bacterium]|nr:GAF domain-containing protein [Myxococcales bacterium]
MQEETQSSTPNALLRSGDLLKLFSTLDPLTNNSERKLASQLLDSLHELPNVQSANLLFINSGGDAYFQVWQSLDGNAQFGEWQPLAGSGWTGILAHGDVWCEDDAAQHPLNDLPALEASFQDRCLIPMKTPQRPLALVILHSQEKAIFSQWDQDLLRLFSQQAAIIFQSTNLINDLDGRLTRYQQRAQSHPPTLQGLLQLGLAALLESRPALAYIDLNLEAIENDLKVLQEAIDFFLDEIRLSAPPEAQERAQQFIERKQLDRMRAELDGMIRDNQEGLLRQQNFLQLLLSLQNATDTPEPLQLSELLTPLLPLAFSGLDNLQIQTDWQTEAQLYAPKTRLQQAFLMLLFSLQKHVRSLGNYSTKLHIHAEQKEERILLRLSYKTPHLSSLEDFGDEYLFARHVVEEVQGSFFFNLKEDRCVINIWFPLMFEAQSSDSGSQEVEAADEHGAFELPALSHLAIETTTISEELAHLKSPPGSVAASPYAASEQAQPTAKPYNPIKKDRFKLLLLGQDQRYMRALRRTLSPPHTLLLARAVPEAIDLVDAHPDLNLILCDMHGFSSFCLEFYAQVKANNSPVADRMLFLTDIHHDGYTQEFIRQMNARCISRYLSAEEMETQLRTKAELLKEVG